jgi:hypothetical protein
MKCRAWTLTVVLAAAGAAGRARRAMTVAIANSDDIKRYIRMNRM